MFLVRNSVVQRSVPLLRRGTGRQPIRNLKSNSQQLRVEKLQTARKLISLLHGILSVHVFQIAYYYFLNICAHRIVQISLVKQ